jgi:hypothetical protein
MVAASAIPYKFAQPWGKSGPSGSVTDPIPNTTGSSTAASQALGFPIGTATPVAAGGAPPSYADFNGAMFYETSWTQWVQAGGPIGYDSTFSANIGGYPAGAVIAAATPLGKRWLSTTDNNVTDPDTGGAGWISGSLGRFLGVQVFAASGIYTPSSSLVGLVILEGVAGGGAGGGTQIMPSAQSAAGGGGQAGGYAKALLTSGFTGGITVTVGAGGTGVSAGTGGAGGATSFGSLLTVPGGAGGGFGSAGFSAPLTSGGGGIGAAVPTTTGQMIVATVGAAGSIGFTLGNAANQQVPGTGGGSPWGTSSIGGVAGYAAGGPGAIGFAGSSANAGGNGATGYLIVWEFSG